MNNSRLYRYPALNEFNNTLSIHHDESHSHAKFHPDFRKPIINKAQARSIRKKTGCNFVITGDIFYYKLYWVNFCHEYGLVNHVNIKEQNGMAIVRDNEVIWYSIPGQPEGLAERKVLIEKTRTKFILEGVRPYLNFITENRKMTKEELNKYADQEASWLRYYGNIDTRTSDPFDDAKFYDRIIGIGYAKRVFPLPFRCVAGYVTSKKPALESSVEELEFSSGLRSAENNIYSALEYVFATNFEGSEKLRDFIRS